MIRESYYLVQLAYLTAGIGMCLIALALIVELVLWHFGFRWRPTWM